MGSYLGNVFAVSVSRALHNGRWMGSGILCEGLALPLEQVVACLRPFQLTLHQPQRLARGKDGLSRLILVSEICCRIHSLDSCWTAAERTPLPDIVK